ncbi:MAG TPA: 3,4-dihydroxy-2-butanone-4-phosphate synthase [Spirochaetota bacterium]|nr:3,4-dihydroxy-2-butanone-4-phosphate synthase [Spirochaetota bacterium]HOH38536.1 3,4-dihydroxy-2-butanone-4-phosphate synthase [Spirochaetota bacterium]HPY02240.1 3,4-dihydroxy-2-butanone-4-phosphate synthase [Spirochaetota bacterium]
MLSQFGNSKERVERAIFSLKNSNGVILVDDEDRENEGDLIFAAETITENQMAMLIRECSGIVCLPMSGQIIDRLNLPMMTQNNMSRNKTAFTVSIEARTGVTTGVSAKDRVATVKAAVSVNAKPEDVVSPGHVFPLRSADGGVFERRGHTEGTVELVRLAGFSPAGILCELTNYDGTMSKLPEIISFSKKHSLPVVSIEDIVSFLSGKNE